MKRSQMTFGLLLILIGIASYWSQFSFSATGFSQIVLPFTKEKEFSYEWSKSENALILNFPTSSPNELEAINHYDERMVRRTLIKDLGPNGTEVRLILKDKNVRALVSSFKDPFRISIDLFDKTYTQKRDPITGLPIDADGSEIADAPEAKPALEAPSAIPSKDSHLASDTAPDSSTGKRKLMQAMPDEFQSTGELKAALAKIDPGIGKGWAEYPPYIYRAQLAPYEGREAPEKEVSSLRNDALKDSQSMANLASKLYDFGHENRALIAYQQVLLKSPGVFEKDAVHLWKFAELHLGQGNFQLADGYYSSIIDKHSTHTLAKFARIRKNDVQALKAIRSNDSQALSSLSAKMDSFQSDNNNEIKAMALIRKSWWSDKQAKHTKDAFPPNCDEMTQRSLESTISKVESQRTAFLASSLVAARITRNDTPWEKPYAKWLNQYFAAYKGPSTEPTRTKLLDDAKNRLAKEIRDTFKRSSYSDVIAMFEGLPEPMKSIKKVPDVAWAIGESYRQLGHKEKAIPFMQNAAQTDVGTDKFKAEFWLSNLSGQVAAEYKAGKGNQENIKKYSELNRSADNQALSTWAKLNSDEKSRLQTAMATAIEEDVASDIKNKAAPTILLEKWTASLTVNPPKMSTSNGTNPTNEQGNFSPSAGTVRVLDELGKKFAELGMNNERRKALELMRFIQPSTLSSDKTAQKVWSDQLLKLAEEHRNANDYLAAGELYVLVGDNAAQSEQQAEANYKGGLLLLRAGKKQDAIKALERAKSDTNNLFYSKLATERLDQILAH